jgi:sugar phosphate isomerase/epimerase
MLRACFSTLSCPDWSFQQIVQYGSEFGFDGVEIRLIERETDLLKLPKFQPAERPKRRRELADSGFEVPVLASNVRFHDLEASVRKEQIETGKAYLDLAKELGASFVRVFGDVVAKNDNGQYRLIGNLISVLEIPSTEVEGLIQGFKSFARASDFLWRPWPFLGMLRLAADKMPVD